MIQKTRRLTQACRDTVGMNSDDRSHEDEGNTHLSLYTVCVCVCLFIMYRVT